MIKKTAQFNKKLLTITGLAVLSLVAITVLVRNNNSKNSNQYVANTSTNQNYNNVKKDEPQISNTNITEIKEVKFGEFSEPGKRTGIQLRINAIDEKSIVYDTSKRNPPDYKSEPYTLEANEKIVSVAITIKNSGTVPYNLCTESFNLSKTVAIELANKATISNLNLDLSLSDVSYQNENKETRKLTNIIRCSTDDGEIQPGLEMNGYFFFKMAKEATPESLVMGPFANNRLTVVERYNLK